MVVDGDMGVLVASALDDPPAVAMHAMADAQDPRERLNVQMHELADAGPLVAHDRRGRREAERAD